MLVNAVCKPTVIFELLHNWTMIGFQVFYILWGICSCCIFPELHNILTVMFLGALLAHWIITAVICVMYKGLRNVESAVTLYVACASTSVMVLGAIPRIFLTLNDALDVTWFPNLNYGFGSYAFFLAEAGGLSLTFGAYPIILISVFLFP